MSDLLLGVGEGSPPDAFFSSLCEAICRLTSMRRAVLFRYDRDRRRVRAVGAHGIELERFAELFVTVDSVPVARRALAEDRVLEVARGRRLRRAELGARAASKACGSCAPRWPPRAATSASCCQRARRRRAATMGEDERHLLWTLGKAIAMASVAREVTASDERSRQLQQRIDLAREIHEGVVQRLFGVSLALSQRRAARRRDPAALRGGGAGGARRPAHRAEAPARTLLAPDGRDVRRRARARARAAPGARDRRSRAATAEEVPASLEALAQSILVEAVRNAHKHARATFVEVSLRNDGGTFVLEVRNDGAELHSGGRGGVGLRLATLEALQHGGVLEYGEPSRASGRCAWSSPPGSDRERSHRARTRRTRRRRGPARRRCAASAACACSSSTTTTSCTGAFG